jgi:hypothetical protein
VRRGIHRVILPEANATTSRTPHELAQARVPVRANMEEVLDLALQEPIFAKRKPRRAVPRVPAAIIRS